MTRLKLRKKVLDLRKQGMSYSQIKKILKVSKSTLSCWLKEYPLTKERISELRNNNEVRIEKFRETMRKKREDRLEKTYQSQKRILLPFNSRELFVAGLFLYWGEGSKFKTSTLSLSNTDPSVIKFFISWLTKSLRVPEKKIRIDLQLYSNMHINQEISYWSKTLKISPIQFTNPYIKETADIKINHKGNFGHGTCNARVGDARLTEKILMSIKAIADHYKN